MVSRRTYLGAIVASAIGAGYTLTRSPDEREVDLLDGNTTIETKTIDGSTAPVTSDSFEIGENHATVIEVTTESSQQHSIELVDQVNGETYTLLSAQQSVKTDQLVSPNPSNYAISIDGALNSWQTKLQIYKSMPDSDEFSQNIPLKTEGVRSKILGPIQLQPYPETTIEFELQETPETTQEVLLTDRNGKNSISMVSVGPDSGSLTQSMTGRLKGVGFVNVRANERWGLTIKKRITQRERREQQNETKGIGVR